MDRISDVRFCDLESEAVLILGEIINDGVRREHFRVGDGGYVTEDLKSARQVIHFAGRKFSIAVIEHGADPR